MATVYWTGGANNGDASSTGNYSGGALPSASDTLIIDTTTQSINAGLSALASIDLAAVIITFGGSIGSESAALELKCTAGTVTVNSTGGDIKIKAATGGIATVEVLGTGSGTLRLASGATISTLNCGVVGNVSVENGCTVTTARSAGCYVTFASNSTAITTLYVAAGSCRSKRSVTTAHVGGSNTKFYSEETAAITTANIYPGAKHYHLSSGTIATENVWTGAEATASGSRYQATVTNSTAFAGGRVFDNDSNITKTNPTVHYGGKGQVDFITMV